MFNDGVNEALGVSVAVGPGNAVGSDAPAFNRQFQRVLRKARKS